MTRTAATYTAQYEDDVVPLAATDFAAAIDLARQDLEAHRARIAADPDPEIRELGGEDRVLVVETGGLYRERWIEATS